MFAFALWDARIETLMLARDRMGIKPLYTAEYNGRLHFASEIRPLLVCADMPARVNLAGVEAYLATGFLTSPYTMFGGIQKVPPAHYLLSRRGNTTLHEYWRLSYQPQARQATGDTIDQFRTILQESVRMRLMSEVPLGALLSGGIDSTTVVALMQTMLANPVSTVSVGFESASFDEAALAARTAQTLGTDHHPIRFTGDSMEDYPAALTAREEPLADATFVAIFKLFQACRQQGLTVVLTGEGSDELLGGYHWHRADALLRPLLRLPRPLRTGVGRLPLEQVYGDTGSRARRILLSSITALPARYGEWIGANHLRIGHSLLSRDLRTALQPDEPLDLFTSWSGHVAQVPQTPSFQRMLWLQSRTRLVDHINHTVDRMSMAQSVEARPVFLDHILWEFCASLPSQLMLRRRPAGLTEKFILREATRGLIPEDVRRRKKKGLWVPTAGWLSRSPLPEWAEAALSQEALRQTGLFDPVAVTELRKEHQRGAPGRAGLLMAVVSLQVWHKEFIRS